VPLNQAVVCHSTAQRNWTDEEVLTTTAKDDLKRLIDEQPDDSTSEELLRELAFHAMIERGLADADAGRAISHEDMKQRIRSWQN